MEFASGNIAKDTALSMQKSTEQNKWKWKQVRQYGALVIEIIDERGLDNLSIDSEYDEEAAAMLDKKYEDLKNRG